MILRFRKIVCRSKIINKTRSTKSPENTARRFRDNHLTNHLVKFLQDGLNLEEMELLEYALAITFLKKIDSGGILTSFNV